MHTCVPVLVHLTALASSTTARDSIGHIDHSIMTHSNKQFQLRGSEICARLSYCAGRGLAT
eukprot:365252-Chlamydomonas_euryale.AAC.9